MYNNDDYLMHYGVKGMKWGVRRARQERNESLRKSYRSFQSDMDKLKKEGKSNDIQAVKKRAAQYNSERRAAKDRYKQIKQVAKGKHAQQKQYGKLEDATIYKKKVKEKDLLKAYGRIEDSLTYHKRSNKKANDYAEKALMEIDRQLSQTGKKPTYDVKKVNDFIDKALQAIDNDLDQYRVG